MGISLGWWLVLGANRLLAMVKDIGGIRPIAIDEMFFLLITRSIVLQF
jgi:hypothetical protein